MARDVFLGTNQGIYRLRGGAVVQLGLVEHTISAIHITALDGADVILAGSYGNGMFRSADGGATWNPANDGLWAKTIRTITQDPSREGSVLCGTEPARAFRSLDGGKRWQELSAVGELPGTSEWYLPYSPRAGALRNFYSPAGSTSEIFASVEVGGLLRSVDGGVNWDYVDLVDDDVHCVTGHPQDPEEMWLALGWAALPGREVDRAALGGVARSVDGGASWTKVIEHDYARAVIVPPARPELVLAAPAKDDWDQAQILVSHDEGESWRRAEQDEPYRNEMIEAFSAGPDGSIWAVGARGGLWTCSPDDWVWEPPFDPGRESVLAVKSIAFRNEE